MTSATLEFDPADLQLLLDRYAPAADEEQPRRPPWTWSALDRTERAALARMIDVWVATYNHVHAITGDDVIPPCWRRHPGLATELAVQVWLWYAAHLDPNTATPAAAGDYYLRHLPGFCARIDRLLGISPGECREGEHPPTWRKDAQDVLTLYDHLAPTPERDASDLELLGALHYGFPVVDGEDRR